MQMLALALAAGLALALLPASTRADGAWLDEPQPAQWNQPRMAVPVAPERTPDDLINPRCLERVRPPETAEDRALVEAGWYLSGAYQAGWGVKIITGAGGFDGMCRPVGYNDFVFVDGIFAGTVSPVIMNSRTDGASARAFIADSDRITVQFVRYAPEDPLCCASRSTSASYRVDFSSGAPVLVLESAFTSPS